MRCRDESYNKLFQVMEGCVNEITYKEIAKCKKLLVIAINNETRFKKSVEALLKENGDMDFVIVAQPAMADVLTKEYDKKFHVICWKGKYTLEVLDRVYESVSANDIDGFLFFSDQGIDLREMNVLSIAGSMQKKGNVRVFSDTIGHDLYEYEKVALYIQSMKLYQEINTFIDIYMTEKAKSMGEVR